MNNIMFKYVSIIYFNIFHIFSMHGTKQTAAACSICVRVVVRIIVCRASIIHSTNPIERRETRETMFHGMSFSNGYCFLKSLSMSLCKHVKQKVHMQQLLELQQLILGYMSQESRVHFMACQQPPVTHSCLS